MSHEESSEEQKELLSEHLKNMDAQHKDFATREDIRKEVRKELEAERRPYFIGVCCIIAVILVFIVALCMEFNVSIQKSRAETVEIYARAQALKEGRPSTNYIKQIR